MDDDNGTAASGSEDGQGGGDAGNGQQTESGKAEPADYDYVQHDEDTSDMEER